MRATGSVVPLVDFWTMEASIGIVRGVLKAAKTWGEPLYRSLVAADLIFISLYFVTAYIGPSFYMTEEGRSWVRNCSYLELCAGWLAIFGAPCLLLRKPIYTIVGLGVGLFSIYLGHQIRYFSYTR